MKKSIVLLFSALLLMACGKEEKTGNLQISGTIKDLKKGTLYIQRLKDTVLVPIDSISVDGDPHFETAITIDSPEILYLYLDRGTTNTIDNNLMFFAEPGKMTIDTDLQTFYAKAKIKGSKNHDLYEEFKKVKARYTNELLALTEERMNALKDNKPFSAEENRMKNEAAIKRKYLYAINFAVNNKDHEIAPYIALAEIPDANVKFLDMIAKAMTPKVAESKYGKMLTKYIAERKKAEAAAAVQ